MDFVDQALARRLESAEEMPQVHYAHLYQKLKPEIGAAVEPICGGHMIFAGLNSPIGRTVGMGFDGSATAADLDRMEQFYRSHDAPSQIDVCPLTDPALFEMLKQRGYMMAELNNVLFRRIDSADSGAMPDGLTIRQGHAAEAGAFADIVVRSFFPDGGAPEGFAEMITPIYQVEGCDPLRCRNRRGNGCLCGWPDHPRTSHYRPVRGGNAARVPPARPANRAASAAHGGSSKSGVRVRRHRHAGRHNLACATPSGSAFRSPTAKPHC